LILIWVHALRDDLSDITHALEQLRDKCGDAEFGYRTQGLFAHVLIRQGYKILDVKAQGHPDIRALGHDREMLVQVKTVAHRSAQAVIELSVEDVAGIAAVGRRGGWFAVLDCATPARWIMVSGSRGARCWAGPYVLRPCGPIAMPNFRRNAANISSRCSRQTRGCRNFAMRRCGAERLDTTGFEVVQPAQ
jgi:hypothetical protein